MLAASPLILSPLATPQDGRYHLADRSLTRTTRNGLHHLALDWPTMGGGKVHGCVRDGERRSVHA